MLFFIGGVIWSGIGNPAVEGAFPFGPVPGQGGEFPADVKDSAFGFTTILRLLTARPYRRADPRRAPGIMAQVPLFLGGYTPSLKSNRTIGIFTDDAAGRPVPGNVEGGVNHADFLYFSCQQ